MVKQVSSKISDPRPRINVVLESDDGKTQATIHNGFVNVQRGKKKAILRVPYGETVGIAELLTEAGKILDKNGYDSKGGSDLEANATDPEAVDETVAAPGSAEAAGVTSIATEGEGASPAQQEVQEELSEDEGVTEEQADANVDAAAQAQADFDREPSYSNPFENQQG